MNGEIYAAYEAKLARARQLNAEVMPHNKRVLFGALSTAGIALVSISFDGVGDSGQIEAVEAFGPDNTSLDLPSPTTSKTSPTTCSAARIAAGKTGRAPTASSAWWRRSNRSRSNTTSATSIPSSIATSSE